MAIIAAKSNLNKIFKVLPQKYQLREDLKNWQKLKIIQK